MLPPLSVSIIYITDLKEQGSITFGGWGWGVGGTDLTKWVSVVKMISKHLWCNVIAPSPIPNKKYEEEENDNNKKGGWVVVGGGGGGLWVIKNGSELILATWMLWPQFNLSDLQIFWQAVIVTLT